MATTQVERREFTEDEIVPGAPATNYVGSDSYAMIVVDVERFKSGPRKGRIKAIVACRAAIEDDGSVVPNPIISWRGWDEERGEQIIEEHHDRFLARVVGPCGFHKEPSRYCGSCRVAGRVRYEARSDGRVAYWDRLVVGYAAEYRDPHF